MILQSHIVDRALYLAAVERELAHQHLPVNQQSAEILASLEAVRATLLENAARRAPRTAEDAVALLGMFVDRRLHYGLAAPHEAELEALAVRQCKGFVAGEVLAA